MDMGITVIAEGTNRMPRWGISTIVIAEAHWGIYLIEMIGYISCTTCKP
jgi:hypothetical protein